MLFRWTHGNIQKVLGNHIIDYPVPINISYNWSYGQLAGLVLVVQIVSGILLGMHYGNHVDIAFASVEHIMRDVEGGYILRYVHANGASMFFIVIYMHIARGLYYSQYKQPRSLLWVQGVIIFLLMIITAFIGYVLPYGQMSFWGATVITNLLSIIPFVGEEVVFWLHGGYGVGNATLNRFLSLHYLLPFLIVGMVLLHLVLLHVVGSSNRIGVQGVVDSIGFYPYCYVKDLLVFMGLLIVWSYFVNFDPNLLGHQDNYIEATSIQTPSHIVPEWYFLLFYGVLRQIEHKVIGVLIMLFQILGLIGLIVDTQKERYKVGLGVNVIQIFLGTSVLLIIFGGEVAEEPYITILGVSTAVYFLILVTLAVSLVTINVMQVVTISKISKRCINI